MLELTNTANKLKADIILIQESKLCAKDKSPCLPGFVTVRKDRGINTGGGLITFIKDDIPFTDIMNPTSIPGSLLEILTVKLEPKSCRNLSFANVYCPPTRGDRRGQEFDTSELPDTKDAIIGGYLNIHSNVWDHWQPEDQMGFEVEAWMTAKDFGVANDGTATRINAGTGGCSAPDITLVHNSLMEKVEWSTTECMGSDHLPIVIDIECNIATINPPPVTELRWNWSSANFTAFTKTIEDAARNFTNDSSISHRMELLNSTILKAAAEHIGKVKATKNSKEWMTREIRSAIKERNRLRRLVGSRREEWIDACRTV